MFSNIEELYDKLPKHLNSALTEFTYCFSSGAKSGRNAKISIFFWFLNLHNLLERACNHIKLYIYILKEHLRMCLEITYSGIAKYPELFLFFPFFLFFFDALKTDQN